MKHTLVTTGSLLALTLCSGAVLSSITTNATDNTDVVDDVSITVPVSCSMTGNGMDSHTASIENGRYVPDIGTTTLKAFCNDNEGFAIYAAGYTGEEVGGENSTKLVGTPTGIGNIDTGIAESGNNSNWAMKLTVKTDSGDTTTNPITIDSAPNTDGGANASFSQYHIVPSTYTKVAHKNSATDMTTTTGGVTLETTYAAYISSTQTAGTYAGKVIYTLVHPAGASAPGPKSLDTASTLQEVTYCSDKLPEGQVYTLTDSRDGNVYHVARLADGKCWMLDNLALDPTDPTTAQNMNENNTNASAEAINNLLHGSSTTTGWSNVAVADVDVFNSYTAPMINNASKDTLVTSYGPASTNGQAKVGIYYNFCAASASTYCYDEYHGLNVPNTDIDASQDICPANWRMPAGGNNGEYVALAREYGSTATEANSFQYNLSTSLSGYYYHGSSSVFGRNQHGYWWSSTYLDNRNMYILYLRSTSVDPNYSFSDDGDCNRQNGYTMRCLMGE